MLEPPAVYPWALFQKNTEWLKVCCNIRTNANYRGNFYLVCWRRLVVFKKDGNYKLWRFLSSLLSILHIVLGPCRKFVATQYKRYWAMQKKLDDIQRMSKRYSTILDTIDLYQSNSKAAWNLQEIICKIFNDIGRYRTISNNIQSYKRDSTLFNGGGPLHYKDMKNCGLINCIVLSLLGW